jgi:hypothetical protein
MDVGEKLKVEGEKCVQAKSQSFDFIFHFSFYFFGFVISLFNPEIFLFYFCRMRINRREDCPSSSFI